MIRLNEEQMENTGFAFDDIETALEYICFHADSLRIKSGFGVIDTGELKCVLDAISCLEVEQ